MLAGKLIVNVERDVLQGNFLFRSGATRVLVNWPIQHLTLFGAVICD
jgi:hypothetical protein